MLAHLKIADIGSSERTLISVLVPFREQIFCHGYKKSKKTRSDRLKDLLRQYVGLLILSKESFGKIVSFFFQKIS